MTRPATRRRGCTSGQRRRHLPPPTRPPPPCFWRRTPGRSRGSGTSRPAVQTEPPPPPPPARHTPNRRPVAPPVSQAPARLVHLLATSSLTSPAPFPHARTHGCLPACPPCRVARAGGPAPCGDLRSERRFRVKKREKEKGGFAVRAEEARDLAFFLPPAGFFCVQPPGNWVNSRSPPWDGPDSAPAPLSLSLSLLPAAAL